MKESVFRPQLLSPFAYIPSNPVDAIRTSPSHTRPQRIQPCTSPQQPSPPSPLPSYSRSAHRPRPRASPPTATGPASVPLDATSPATARAIHSLAGTPSAYVPSARRLWSYPTSNVLIVGVTGRPRERRPLRDRVPGRKLWRRALHVPEPRPRLPECQHGHEHPVVQVFREQRLRLIAVILQVRLRGVRSSKVARLHHQIFMTSVFNALTCLRMNRCIPCKLPLNGDVIYGRMARPAGPKVAELSLTASRP